MDSEKHIIVMVLLWIIGFIGAAVAPFIININVDLPLIELTAITFATIISWAYIIFVHFQRGNAAG
jgi:hypothetical protein